MAQTELVTAAVLEERGILKRGTAYKMLQANLLTAYRVGAKGRGIRFKVDEVLAALRRPAATEQAAPQ
jgi:excisionase family DNA binding protein